MSEAWDDANSEKHKILLFLHKIKRDFRNEKVFIYLVLNFLLIRSELNLENILFI